MKHIQINRKKAIQVGLLIFTVLLILLLVYVGGGWVIETFKEMHGM